jgi:predicted amidophosphoribosyltransferase
LEVIAMKIRIPLLDRLLGRHTATCPECQHTTRTDQTYCEICGYAIVDQAKADVAKMKPI